MWPRRATKETDGVARTDAPQGRHPGVQGFRKRSNWAGQPSKASDYPAGSRTWSGRTETGMEARSIFEYIGCGTCLRFLQDAREGFDVHGDGRVLGNIDSLLGIWNTSS